MVTIAKPKLVLLSLFMLCLGIMIGGYAFSKSQPRSVLSITRCQDCLSPKDLAGLLASVGIQKLSGFIPSVVFETDRTIAIKHPFAEARFHYVIIPKKDIRNIGELSEDDAPYLSDAYLVARHIIEKEKLSNYRLYTNGPGFQDVTYLHFHLISR